jgi:hypothetical protein
MPTAGFSVIANAGLWQVAQLTVRSLYSRSSTKSFSLSATVARVIGLSACVKNAVEHLGVHQE